MIGAYRFQVKPKIGKSPFIAFTYFRFEQIWVINRRFYYLFR
jgi:hypothetical protein